MEIDPKKMVFGKMKSGENLEGNMVANQLPMSLKSPTDLLSEAWQLYKARWKTFLGIMIAPVLLIILAFVVFVVASFGMGFLGSFISKFSSANVASYPIAFVLPLILFLGIIIIQFWGQAALIFAIKDSGENIGIKESYKRGWRKIKPFIWVSVLLSLIMFGGYVFFVIPWIIFSIWFAFATFIVITENLKGMNAILKSREYVRNYWWSIFWRLLFLFIVILGAFIIILLLSQIITGILTGVLLFFIEEAATAIMAILYLGSFVLMAIAIASIAPLTTIYLFLVYGNLRKIKGDFEFSPSSKLKKFFIAIGVLGILIIIAIPIFLFSMMFLSLNSAQNKVMDINKYNRQNSDSRFDGMTDDNKSQSSQKSMRVSEDVLERDVQRVLNLTSIDTALSNYKIKNGIYPISETSVKLNEENDVVNEIKPFVQSADDLIDSKNPEYYYSYKSTDGKSFELTARFENLDNPNCDLEIKKKSNICIYKLRY